MHDPVRASVFMLLPTALCSEADHGVPRRLGLRQRGDLAERHRLGGKPQPVIAHIPRMALLFVGDQFGHGQPAESSWHGPMPQRRNAFNWFGP